MQACMGTKVSLYVNNTGTFFTLTVENKLRWHSPECCGDHAEAELTWGLREAKVLAGHNKGISLWCYEENYEAWKKKVQPTHGNAQVVANFMW